MGKFWEQRKLGDLTNVLSASRVHKNEWISEGVPFYRSSDVVSAFKGKNNEKVFISIELYRELIKKSGCLEKGDLLITGGGSIGIPYIVPDDKPLYSKDADLIWIKKSPYYDSQYLYTYFTSSNFKRYIDEISHVGTIAHYTIEQVKFTSIPIPSLNEQKQIGQFFLTFDSLITLEQHHLDLLKEQKKGLLQKMFPKDGSNVPELRFPEFTDPWKQRKLSQISSRITKKNKDQAISRPLTISAQYGLIDQEDFFKKRIASKDLANYLVVNRGEFAYNKSYSEGYPWGTIKRLDFYENGVVSSLYIVFSIENTQVDSNYLNTFFETDKWYLEIRKKAAEGARNHGLLNITSEDFFDMKIKIPSLSEQVQIGSFFSNIDNLITLHQHQLDLLKEQKKGLLQKMFPKEGEDEPELRFLEFR